MDERSVPLLVAAEQAGCTYRQASFWCSQGYVRVVYVSRVSGEPAAVREGMGTGYRAMVSREELGVLHLMARLTRCGFLPEAAARAARELLEYGQERVRLGQGFALECVELAREGGWGTASLVTCGVVFPGQDLECEGLAGHSGPHRSGRLTWDELGAYRYA